jgi:cytochrome c peroxidase
MLQSAFFLTEKPIRTSRGRATSLFVVALSLGACTDGPVPSACEEQLGISAIACSQLEALVLPETLPPSPGNAVADDDNAANLGFGIFYDARFSSNQDVRCATCHEPEAFFDDDLAVSTSSLGTVTRNSPTVLNVAWLAHDGTAAVFWDGRTDSLWSQPLFAFETEIEMDFSRLEIAHRIERSYRSEYEALFGPLPPLDDTARFPDAGKPGDPAFDTMTADDRAAVNRIAANVGKALDAYMRKLATGRSRVDHTLIAGFESGLEDLSDAERRGIALFAESGCLRCHSGPLLSDSDFHNAGVPALDAITPDRGRADGATVLADAREDENAFTLASAFADPPPGGGAHDTPTTEELREEARDPASLGAIRTPTLRNLSYSAPYGHNGRYATLDAFLEQHLAGGADEGFIGTVDPLLEAVALSDDERADLGAFLLALDGEYPLPPWNNWPDR